MLLHVYYSECEISDHFLIQDHARRKIIVRPDEDCISQPDMDVRYIIDYNISQDEVMQ